MERDLKKARDYYEVAAMGGHVKARQNLGILEASVGNKTLTKDEFEKALRSTKKQKMT